MTPAPSARQSRHHSEELAPMGAIKGFFTGFTLTSTALYVSLLMHQRHRARQSRQLKQQSLILNSIVEPSLVAEEEPPKFALQRVNWTETWKDRWNAEVESTVRWAQGIRWDDVRAGIEGRVKQWQEGGRKA